MLTSFYSGLASIGVGGQSAPLDTKKIVKNREKEGKKLGKREENWENWEKEEKSGRFFHFAPPDK